MQCMSSAVKLEGHSGKKTEKCIKNTGKCYFHV